MNTHNMQVHVELNIDFLELPEDFRRESKKRSNKP